VVVVFNLGCVDLVHVANKNYAAKRKLLGRSERIHGGRKSILLLGDSQVMPARSSDENKMRVKTWGGKQ
jgi:hypothetical protein